MAEYEAKNEILTIRRGDGSYTRYQIGTGTADTQYVIYLQSQPPNPRSRTVTPSHPHIPDYDGEPQRTEFEGPDGEGAAEFEKHKHDLVIKPWLPNVGDRVVGRMFLL